MIKARILHLLIYWLNSTERLFVMRVRVTKTYQKKDGDNFFGSLCCSVLTMEATQIKSCTRRQYINVIDINTATTIS